MIKILFLIVILINKINTNVHEDKKHLGREIAEKAKKEKCSSYENVIIGEEILSKIFKDMEKREKEGLLGILKHFKNKIKVKTKNYKEWSDISFKYEMEGLGIMIMDYFSKKISQYKNKI